MQTIFVLTHIIMITCIGVICISISAKNSGEREVKKTVNHLSNLKPTRSPAILFYRTVTSSLAAFQNSILLIFNIDNSKT